MDFWFMLSALLIQVYLKSETEYGQCFILCLEQPSLQYGIRVLLCMHDDVGH